MKRSLRSFYSWLIRTLYLQRKAPFLPPDRINSILVVRTDGMGDLLLALPMLRHLKETFGPCSITLLAYRDWVDMARLCPDVDEVIGWDRQQYEKSLSYRLDFIRKLRSKVYAFAIHSKYSRQPHTDELVACCRAAQKFGFDGDLTNISAKDKARGDSYYTRLIKPIASSALELDRNRDFTEQLIGKPIAPADFQPQIWLDEADRLAATELLKSNGVSPESGLLIVLYPAASWEAKMWPFDRYAQLAGRILQRYKARIVICGAAADAKGAAKVAAAVPDSVNLAGKTTVRQMAAVFEACDLFLGNDTGPLHMAVSVGIPTIGIIGGGFFGRFYPYGDLQRNRMVNKHLLCHSCNWKCIYDTVRCIQEITVEDVWRETVRMIEEVVLPSRPARK